ncbi:MULTISPECIES: hypothetical protein [unclassified Microbacterium]|uniref:hypothetical protein n=1 Tax=unclassified Microbacterium TaxID=2609290 RepID=UPI0021A30E34|nr:MULTISPECIES: hypothetical protein [unclassified Microbacterium]MCT1364037.1 hypothetical protein [Microbacterium sp. p3-SID131]MCT1375321.1 hypothetical protein [Microbacterium sp. p3-SID337]
MSDYLSQLLDAAPPASVVALVAVSAHYCLKVLLAIMATFGRGERRKNAERVLKLLVRPKRPRGS